MASVMTKQPLRPTLNLERLALLACVGAVLAAEAFNTAVEAAVDLATETFHEKARIAKDAAAGAVLVLSSISVLVLLAVLLAHAPSLAEQSSRIARQLWVGVPLAACASALLWRSSRSRAIDAVLAIVGLALLGLQATWTTSAAFTSLAALLFSACVAVRWRGIRESSRRPVVVEGVDRRQQLTAEGEAATVSKLGPLEP